MPTRLWTGSVSCISKLSLVAACRFMNLLILKLMITLVLTFFTRVTGTITKATAVYYCLLEVDVATVPDFLCSKDV